METTLDTFSGASLDAAPDALPEPISATTFDSIGLGAPLVATLGELQHQHPTPVQAAAIPAALAGEDLMISAQTGSGKTAAYLLPALQRIAATRPAMAPGAHAAPGRMQGKRPRRDGMAPAPTPRAPQGSAPGPAVLVLAPTRELALQVADAAFALGRRVPRLGIALLVGGVPYGGQLRALREQPDLVIATPGRLMDLMRSGAASVADVQLLVLDEADRMLDLGFVDDIRLIAQALPAGRQTLMTSATFDGSVGKLASSLMRAPRRIAVDAPTERHADIEQRLHWADDLPHRQALLEQLLTDPQIDQAIVFTRTQREADDVADGLQQIGHHAAALHGGLPQGRRNRVLDALRTRRLRVLVATDVAARGIDVPGISHVINIGLPMKAEDYVHRIGRTGRAGRSGLALTLAMRGDIGMVRRVQQYTAQPIPVGVVAGQEPRKPAPVLTAGGPRGAVGDGGRSADRNGPGRGARPAPRRGAGPKWPRESARGRNGGAPRPR